MDYCDYQVGMTGIFSFLVGYALGLPPLFDVENGKTDSIIADTYIDNLVQIAHNANLGKNGENSFNKNMRLFLKNKKFINEKVNLFSDKLISYRVK